MLTWVAGGCVNGGATYERIAKTVWLRLWGFYFFYEFSESTLSIRKIGEMTSPSDWWVLCYLVFLGTKVKRNKQVGAVASWGPTFRVAVDIIVHSAGSGDSSILRFTSTSHQCCKMGDRLPGIFFYSKGYLHITSAVNKNANYYVNYNIDLKKWYHIEIAQTKMNGKVTESHDFFLLI